jgi:hypothetical protein
VELIRILLSLTIKLCQEEWEHTEKEEDHPKPKKRLAGRLARKGRKNIR